jgi:hypothetical protein
MGGLLAVSVMMARFISATSKPQFLFGFAQGRLSTSFGWRLTSLSMTLTSMRYWVRVFLEHSITFLTLGESRTKAEFASSLC